MGRVAVGRLKRRPDFLLVAEARRKCATAGLILQARRRVGDAPAALPEGLVRVGFTATRKIGNAVARNRARRRLKAAADRVMALEAAPGHDLVVIARQATLSRPFALLLADLRHALGRVGAKVAADTVSGGA